MKENHLSFIRITSLSILGFLIILSTVNAQDSIEVEPLASTSVSLEDEIRQLQRDTISLQRTMMESGISAQMREDLQKVYKLDAMEAEIKALTDANAEMETELKQMKGRQDKMTALESAAEQAAQGFVGANLVWVLLAAFLVMLMQAGFAFLEGGFTRPKNVAHTMSMNLLDYSIGMLAFWAFGFAIMFGNVGENADLGIAADTLNTGFSVGQDGKWSIMGTEGWFLSGEILITSGIFALFMFQLVFANTANTIPTGTLAERWKLTGFAFHSVMVAGFIYPLFGHWVWGGGWLAELGFADFAGSTVVHMAGGVLALVGAYVVGPRVGKFNQDGTANPIPGHNLPMAFLGTFLLAFGWFGFNAGSTLSGTNTTIGIISANTALASGAGCMVAAITSRLKFGKVDPSFICNGLLAGLVGITAPCAFVDAWAAVVIGAICGVVVVYSVLFIEDFMKLDDPVGAISVHGTCGAIGGLAVGIFANGDNGVTGIFLGDGRQFVVQVVGVFTCFITFGVLGYLMYMISNKIVKNRATDAEQIAGLDISEMGIEAYAYANKEEEK
ncbi:MAG: ammonium transporter [Verrucomicrobiota bacterium]